MSLKYFTVRIPMKTPSDGRLVLRLLTYKSKPLFSNVNGIKTIRDIRFSLPDPDTLLFEGYFGEEFEFNAASLASHTHNVFDTIFRHVSNPPLLPIAKNMDSFTKWVGDAKWF
jgi:hypothetical protein